MRAILVAMLLVIASPAFADSGIPEYFDGAAQGVSDDELVVKYEAADTACRGSDPSDIAMYEGCALREAYGVLLDGRHICYVGFPANHRWEPCKE